MFTRFLVQMILLEVFADGVCLSAQDLSFRAGTNKRRA